MKLLLATGLVLFLSGCGPSNAEVNAMVRKHADCTKAARNRNDAALAKCGDRFSSSYLPCFKKAEAKFEEDIINCSMLEE